ncbi:hypothetical protein [Almyronema epifaneia]|uniref:Uncharacterized protein n=1 Tax=Almyronema epifaneia S1 TaxID=2991925 RepID=A0ABW6ILL5_9CYAN
MKTKRERSKEEKQRHQKVHSRFGYLSTLVWLTSGTSLSISLLSSILFSNWGIGIAGLGTTGLSFAALKSSRERATQTAITLLLQSNKDWEHRLATSEQERSSQIERLSRDRDFLQTAQTELLQKLTEVQAQASDRQEQIRTLQAEASQMTGQLSRLQVQVTELAARDSANQTELGQRREQVKTLSQRLARMQESLEQAQSRLSEKRYDLAVHLDAIEVQILDVWNPLYQGLIAICDRFDPNRPVSNLEYAGKPVELEESEKKCWTHYRRSLVTYDAGLRDRVNAMSEECESHDDAYSFFLTLLEELTLSYCKLWSGIKDLELGTTHEGEKQAIYAEFEQLRDDYVSEASQWVERSSQVEVGFNVIEDSFKQELASLQQRIVDAEALIEVLQAPRQFPGETSIDKAGNRLIDHFATHSVILDAVESVKVPGGFRLRFKVDRNPTTTKLTESEIDKICSEVGVWGVSQHSLSGADFELDARNFLLEVVLSTPGESQSRSAKSRKRSAPSSTAVKAETLGAELVAERFTELGCYSAAEFEEVVALKFVPRVRVVAGSTGGKSPLLELIACAIAQLQKGQLWLINPIPGSPKDWFHVPGVVPAGIDGIQESIKWLEEAHCEFQRRRNDLPGTAGKPFITVMVDEINAIARDYPELGLVMKDFYQLSDHTRMGFLTAGQGANVSGLSGGSQTHKKTGNATKLMAEDFENATQVFTATAAKVWINKHLKGHQMKAFEERLDALNQLCAELNEAEGKSAYPTDPNRKVVSPDAYRIALVASPREAEPFFIQLPAYSSYVGQLEGVEFPEGAEVTAPRENQMSLGLLDGRTPPDTQCVHCGHDRFRRKGEYADGRLRYVCSNCGRVPAQLDATARRG